MSPLRAESDAGDVRPEQRTAARPVRLLLLVLVIGSCSTTGPLCARGAQPLTLKEAEHFQDDDDYDDDSDDVEDVPVHDLVGLPVRT